MFQQNPNCLGPIPGPNKQICTLFRQSYSESDSVFRLTPVCLVVSVLECSFLGFGVASWFNDHNPTTQACSSLNLWIQVFSMSFTCVFGFEVDTPLKHSELSPCIAVLTSWFGLWNNAVPCLPLRKLPDFPQMRFEQPSCSLEVCSVDVVVFQLQWCHFVWQTHRHHDWVEHLACWIQTRLCLALEPSHKHFLNNSINLFTFRSRTQPNLFLLHRSPLVISSAGETGYAMSLYTSHGSQSTPDLQANIHRWHLPESSSFFQDLFTFKRGFWYWACNLPSCVHLIILFNLFTKHLQNRFHQYWIVHIQQRGLPQISPPKFPVHVFQSDSPKLCSLSYCL